MMSDFVLPAHIAGEIDGLRDRLAAGADLQADEVVGVLDIHGHAVLADDLDCARRRQFQLAQPGEGAGWLVGVRLLEPEPIVLDMDSVNALQRRHQAGIVVESRCSWLLTCLTQSSVIPKTAWPGPTIFTTLSLGSGFVVGSLTLEARLRGGYLFCVAAHFRKDFPMERVLGIGGVFFKARDPKALAAWYREHLGVPVDPGQTYGLLISGGAGEKTVWATFPADTKYFGPGQATLMVNYRVSNLDAMLAQLRAAGAQVEEKVEDYDYGRFGWAADPEGNRFELWEPR
jgi:predicted enzyme related to lactoylglutathione lyase